MIDALVIDGSSSNSSFCHILLHLEHFKFHLGNIKRFSPCVSVVKMYCRVEMMNPLPEDDCILWKLCPVCDEFFGIVLWQLFTLAWGSSFLESIYTEIIYKRVRNLCGRWRAKFFRRIGLILSSDTFYG